MHEQCLGGVAHTRALHLGVDRDGDRLGRVGCGIDIDMAVAARRSQHRDPRVLKQEVLELLAASRDHHVGGQRVGHERSAVIAVVAQRLHRVGGEAGRGQSLAEHVEQNAVLV